MISCHFPKNVNKKLSNFFSMLTGFYIKYPYLIKVNNTDFELNFKTTFLIIHYLFANLLATFNKAFL